MQHVVFVGINIQDVNSLELSWLGINAKRIYTRTYE